MYRTAITCATALAAVFLNTSLTAQESPTQERPTGESADRRCIPLNTILDTAVISDHEVIMTLRNDSHVRLSLAGSCPQLEYQGRFTYGATAGQLCAGRDRIITRSGDSCLIQTFQDVEGPE